MISLIIHFLVSLMEIGLFDSCASAKMHTDYLKEHIILVWLTLKP